MSQGAGISHQMEYLLATGNLVSRSGLGLMQVTDYEEFFHVFYMRSLHSPLRYNSFEYQHMTND